MNDIIDRAQQKVALLREHRTRLIADVVTSKVDVREAAAKLPDKPDEFEDVDETIGLAEEADAFVGNLDLECNEVEG